MNRSNLRAGILLGVLASPFGLLSGATASEPVRVAASDGADRDAKQPQVAVDARGRIYVTFGRGGTVRLAASTDGGKTFDENTVGSVGALALGMRRGPRVTATDGSVVVTAIGGKEGKGRDGDVLAWRSQDGGKTWAGPSRVNAVEGSAREGLHGMAAAPDGKVFCTWLDLRSGKMEVYGSLSKDGGATWEPDALVYRSPDGSVCECCHPSAAFGPDGTLHVMWRNSLKGARDLYITNSSDGGKSFGPAEKLGRGSWPLNACPMDGGAVAAGPEGRVETVWMRAGAMFAARPGEAERSLGRGVQGWAAFGADGPYSVWLEERPGKLLALTPAADSPLILAERANDPVVAAAPNGRGPVVVAWEDKADGGILAHVFTPKAEEAPR
ncbi:sialidase family protein [Planctomyces sp. SH-PL62]|uniref:sialidase family protein n=1 Tax=Planctomyces sp. SH-PL62 TaxID=1636152 RepID=UPI00078C8184|nr:sialidase family protein [Planctomyces sp. SH-PL62]AMV38111.1 BNR/Asp-box repeat protein [Planctomyces sp. SH-PL62]